MSYRIVGQPTPRTDALGRVTGEACYTSDVLLPGTLWAKALRSPYGHARIARIDAARAEKYPGVHAVATGADVRAILYGRRYRDLSVLAQDGVRFVGERFAASCVECDWRAARDLRSLRVAPTSIPSAVTEEGTA